MSGNAELLNFIYQNSQMGVDTISQLLEISQDGEFKAHMCRQLEGYQEFHKEARQCLNQNGYDEKGISTFEKVRTYLMVNIQTMTDKTSSHIAEMLIIGSNMGVVDAIKNIRKYKDVEKDIVKLMERLKKFEESNIEKLKEFL